MSFGGLGSAEGRLLIDISQAMANLQTLEGRVKSLGTTGGDAFAPLAQSGGRLDALGTRLEGINKKYGQVGKAALGVGAIVAAGFGLSINSAANFEAAMDGAASVLQGAGENGKLTTEQFSALNDMALKVGASTSASATEVAGVIQTLGRTGVEFGTIMDGAALGVVQLSEATGESLDQSAESFGALSNLFKDTGISATDMTDVIVNGMNASGATLSEFQTGIARLSPVISATNMSFQDSAAAIAYFNSQGFSAAEVGTSLTAAFNNLVNPTTEQAAAQERLGISAFDAQGKFVGFPAIMDQVAKATEGMDDATRAATLSQIFGADAMDLMTLASRKGGAGLSEYEDKMGKSGTAAQQAAERMDNLQGSIEQLRGAIESAAIIVGSFFAPAIRLLADLVSGLVNKFIDLPKPIQQAIAALVGIVGAVLGIAGAIVVFGPAAVSMVSALGAIVGALAAVAAPILLIIGLIALLAIAYKTNFLGFADAVNAVASAVIGKLSAIASGIARFASQVAAAFGAFRSIGQNPVAAAFNAIGLELEAVAGKFGPFEGVVKGIASGFRTVGKAAQTAGNILKGMKATFDNLRKNGMSPVGAALSALSSGLIGNSSLFGRFAPIVEAAGRALSVASTFVESFINRFNQLRGTTDTVNAVFQALGDALSNIAGHFGPLEGAVNSVADALRSLGLASVDFIDAFQAILDGDWSEAWDEIKSGAESFLDALSNLGDAGVAALGALWDALSGVDWGGVLDTILGALGNLSDALLGWIGEAAGAIADYDWAGLWNGVKDVTATIVGKLGKLGAAIAQWLVDAVSGINWDALWFGVKDVTKTIVGKLGDLGAAIATWLVNAVSNINWGAMFATVKDVTKDIVTKFGNLNAAIATWLVNAVSGINWGAVFATVKDVTKDIVSRLGNLNAAIAQWLVNAVSGINWGAMFATVKDVTQDIVQKFGDLKAAIATWLVNAVSGINWGAIWNGVQEVATTLVDRFGDLLAAITVWVSTAITGVDWTALGGQILDALTTALTGLGDLQGKFLSFAKNIATGIAKDVATSVQGWDGSTIINAISTRLSAVGSLVGRFLSFGINIATGIAKDVATAVQAWDGSTIITAISTKLGQVGSLVGKFTAFAAALGGGLLEDLKSWVVANITMDTIVGWVTGGVLSRKVRVPGSDNGARDKNTMPEQGEKVPPLDLTAYNASLVAMQTATTAAFVAIGLAAQIGVTFMSSVVGSTVTTMASQMNSILGNMASQAASRFASMRSQVASAAQGMASQVTNSISQMASQVTSRMSQMASQASSQASNMRSQVGSAMQSMVSQASSAMSSFSSAVQSGFQRAASAAQSGVSSIRAAVNSLGSMYSQGFSVGASLGDGLAAGMNSRVGAVQAAASALANAASAALNLAAQVSSPSRLTIRTGRYMAEGLEIGFRRGTPDVVAAFRDMIPYAGGSAFDFASRFPSSSTPSVVHHTTIVAVRSEEWTNYANKAEVGFDFANEFTFLAGQR